MNMPIGDLPDNKEETAKRSPLVAADDESYWGFVVV
jgi:hypothetical protein